MDAVNRKKAIDDAAAAATEAAHAITVEVNSNEKERIETNRKETDTKQDETKQNGHKTKRTQNEKERNETKRKEKKRNETKRNETKRNETDTKRNETKVSVHHVVDYPPPSHLTPIRHYYFIYISATSFTNLVSSDFKLLDSNHLTRLALHSILSYLILLHCFSA